MSSASQIGQHKNSDQPDGIIVVTVGGEIFELFPYCQGESLVDGWTVYNYAKKYGIDTGESGDIFKHFDKYWDDLPVSVRKDHYLVFPMYYRGWARNVWELIGTGDSPWKTYEPFDREFWGGRGLLVRHKFSLA